MINIDQDLDPDLGLVLVDRIVDRGTLGRDHDRIHVEEAVLVVQHTAERDELAMENIRSLIGVSESSV